MKLDDIIRYLVMNFNEKEIYLMLATMIETIIPKENHEIYLKGIEKIREGSR